jgi:hypothetical protein
MKLLLESCNVPKLSVPDMCSLAYIIDKTFPDNNTASKTSAEVPLSVFMCWMREVFNLELGGLTRSARPPPSTNDLQGLQGFAAAILREHARQSEQHDLYMNASLPTSSRGSTIDPSHHLQTAFLEHQDATAGPQKSRGFPPEKSKYLGPKHKGPSRSQTKQSSRADQRKLLSSRNSVDTVPPSNENDGCSKHLVLVGLPSSEVLLGHRAVRVTSVDHGKASLNLDAAGSVPCADRLCLSDSGQKPAERTVKTAEPFDAVVSSAISRLELLELIQDNED